MAHHTVTCNRDMCPLGPPFSSCPLTLSHNVSCDAVEVEWASSLANDGADITTYELEYREYDITCTNDDCWLRVDGRIGAAIPPVWSEVRYIV